MRGLRLFLAGIILLVNPFVVAASETREELFQELKALKERIEMLEKRLAEMRSQTQEVQRSHEELREIKEVLKGLEIGFSATAFVLGTGGNDKNEEIGPEELRKDRVDGGIKVELELSKEVVEGGKITAVLEASQGGRTSDRLPSFWGVEDVIGEYKESPTGEVSKLFYSQELMGGRVLLNLGKIDISDFFDQNEGAGDETTQFLSPGFVHSVAIDFPDNGPGMVVQVKPSDLLGFSLGWAEGDWSELGRKPFFMGEFVLHPKLKDLQGHYRFYGWYREKRGEEAKGWKGHGEEGWGIGVSFDQELSPGFRAFLRVGYQNEELYEYGWAWSVGGELKGVLWGRDEDAFGLAFGMAHLSEEYEDSKRREGEPYTHEDEARLEAYYRLQLTERLSLSPDLQVLWNAQGDSRFDPVVVFGLRGHLEF